MKRWMIASLVYTMLALVAGAALAKVPRLAPHDVTGELVQPGPAVPHCGTMHFIVVMKYRVVAVARGALAKGAEIYVAVSCPEQHGLRFEVGARHRLELQEKRPWTTGAVVPDPDMPAPSPLYWAVSLSRPAAEPPR